MASDTHPLPVRISKVTDRYLLFDIDDIMYLRRHHNICSPFVGTMPQAPSQNVFMGLPIELMAEEAKVLVLKKVAYVVDDSVFHPARLAASSSSSSSSSTSSVDGDHRQQQQTARDAYLQAMRRDGTRAAAAARELADYKKAQALSKVNNNKTKKGKKDKSAATISTTTTAAGAAEEGKNVDDASVSVEEENDPTSLLFSDSTAADAKITKPKPQAPAAAAIEPYAITPVTSGALLTPPPEEDTSSLVDAGRGYPLYAHLHRKGYYMMPGIRFGCDYNVYPGDPLRYHSHFQATHYGWNEEIKLLDLVTGGRLGTNVKKAYLIGGSAPADRAGVDVDSESDGETSAFAPPVRAFSIEWAAM